MYSVAGSGSCSRFRLLSKAISHAVTTDIANGSRDSSIRATADEDSLPGSDANQTKACVSRMSIVCYFRFSGQSFSGTPWQGSPTYVAPASSGSGVNFGDSSTWGTKSATGRPLRQRTIGSPLSSTAVTSLDKCVFASYKLTRFMRRFCQTRPSLVKLDISCAQPSLIR